MSLDGPEIAGLVFGSLIVVGLGYKGIEYMQGSNDDRYNQTKEESRNRDSNDISAGSRRRKNRNQNKSKRK